MHTKSVCKQQCDILSYVGHCFLWISSHLPFLLRKHLKVCWGYYVSWNSVSPWLQHDLILKDDLKLLYWPLISEYKVIKLIHKAKQEKMGTEHMRHTLYLVIFTSLLTVQWGGLAPLNKTPLCQYAAAASEMPYSDTWPSMGVCGLQPQDRGVVFFKGINPTNLNSRILTALEFFVL